MSQPGTIPSDIAQRVLEDSEYVRALEDVLVKGKAFIEVYRDLVGPVGDSSLLSALNEAINEAELMR